MLLITTLPWNSTAWKGWESALWLVLHCAEIKLDLGTFTICFARDHSSRCWTSPWSSCPMARSCQLLPFWPYQMIDGQLIAIVGVDISSMDQWQLQDNIEKNDKDKVLQDQRLDVWQHCRCLQFSPSDPGQSQCVLGPVDLYTLRDIRQSPKWLRKWRSCAFGLNSDLRQTKLLTKYANLNLQLKSSLENDNASDLRKAPTGSHRALKDLDLGWQARCGFFW